jgi:hypothetical protein
MCKSRLPNSAEVPVAIPVHIKLLSGGTVVSSFPDLTESTVRLRTILTIYRGENETIQNFLFFLQKKELTLQAAGKTADIRETSNLKR